MKKNKLLGTKMYDNWLFSCEREREVERRD